MALFNEILTGRYNRALQKLFQIKGSPPAPQLAGEIAATISMFYGAENRYIEGWNRFGIGVFSGVPTAANRAAVRIRMPANSGVVGVVERISVIKGTTTSLPQMFYDSIATAMPTENVTNAGARSLDTRQQQTNSNAIVSTSVNFGVLGTEAFIGACTSSVAFEFIWTDINEISLPPGSQITIGDDILADQLLVSFMWRERPLEESEKT